MRTCLKRSCGSFLLLAALLTSAIFLSCNDKTPDHIAQYPTEEYEYTSLDTAKAKVHTTVYVPIYSHSYMVNGKRPTDFAATLSIRSTDFRDSIFVSNIDYYNSKGELIKKYINKVLLLKPMHSSEFIVEEADRAGGAGAYFIVNWSSKYGISEPLVQAIMLSTDGSLGFSFKTDGIKISPR
ncbi:DUF3124 domain-containing protein [Flavisolibacter nicotianae]|uniref:DUF3124 domain-containing protein n=1 Tax=Flavisolibacter nicotianae TaxID=2364882 RepID=UPI0013C50FD9|nr:DUF3124 domain-containing protein [Flavisolibacter nicotianae]